MPCGRGSGCHAAPLSCAAQPAPPGLSSTKITLSQHDGCERFGSTAPQKHRPQVSAPLYPANVGSLNPARGHCFCNGIPAGTLPFQKTSALTDFAAWPSAGLRIPLGTTQGRLPRDVHLWFNISHSITSHFSTGARGHFPSLFRRLSRAGKIPSCKDTLENTHPAPSSAFRFPYFKRWGHPEAHPCFYATGPPSL